MQDSISSYGNWQTVDEVVVPSGNQEPLVPYGMKSGVTSKPATTYYGWQAKRDSIAKAREDSVTRAVNDSLAHIKSGYGLVMESPYENREMPMQLSHHTSQGMSWVFAILGLIFCVVCLKLKNTPGYMRTLWMDMLEVRMRHNVFDNTVKETSFLIILIVGWICCAGVLLWQLIQTFGGMPFVATPQPMPDHPLLGMGICAAVAGVYVVFMLIAYEITGNVFSDGNITRLWVKGASAGMGLEVFLLFPLALLTLCYPEWDKILLCVGGGIIGIGKIVFIYKGFRIFFQQLRSWLVFLCYLCSLEIIPMILAYLLAYQICGNWL